MKNPVVKSRVRLNDPTVEDNIGMDFRKKACEGQKWIGQNTVLGFCDYEKNLL